MLQVVNQVIHDVSDEGKSDRGGNSGCSSHDHGIDGGRGSVVVMMQIRMWVKVKVKIVVAVVVVVMTRRVRLITFSCTVKY